MAAVTRWALLMGLTALACGDGIRPDVYRGEPLHTIEGVSIADLSFLREDDQGTRRYALFWTTEPNRPDIDEIPWIQDRATTAEYAPPATFVMQVFSTPPTGPGGYAVGAVLVWQDADEDGLRDPDERWIGSARASGVVYSTRSTVDSGLTALEVPPGFADVNLPLTCGARLDPVGGDACLGDELGAQCGGDAECGDFYVCPGGETCEGECPPECELENVCLESVLASRTPSGICARLDRVGFSTPCGIGARRIPTSGGSLLRAIDRVVGVWLAACESDGGCERAGFVCAPGLAVCLPAPQFEVTSYLENPTPLVCLEQFQFGAFIEPEEGEG